MPRNEQYCDGDKGLARSKTLLRQTLLKRTKASTFHILRSMNMHSNVANIYTLLCLPAKTKQNNPRVRQNKGNNPRSESTTKEVLNENCLISGNTDLTWHMYVEQTIAHHHRCSPNSTTVWVYSTSRKLVRKHKSFGVLRLAEKHVSLPKSLVCVDLGNSIPDGNIVLKHRHGWYKNITLILKIKHTFRFYFRFCIVKQDTFAGGATIATCDFERAQVARILIYERVTALLISGR